MSRSIRMLLLVGCSGLGVLHLPEAASALASGMSSPLGEVRAMERSAVAAPPLDMSEELALDRALAKRD